MPRVIRTLVLALGLWLVAAPAARGDGLPVIDLDTTRTGIESPIDGSRYYAISEGGSTRVAKLTLEPDARGRTLDSTELRGVLAVPGVAFDGTTSGLSADGRTLTLIEPREGFPRRETRLVVLDTQRLDRTATIDLEGDFSFDAISPDGETIYLIHYLSRADPTRYEVRAYDLGERKLLAEPIIDRRIAPEVMQGFPITRATSPDGAWAYTLYDGGGGMPFVHALNTAEGTALCIDLDLLQGWSGNLFALGLATSPDGGAVDVLARDGVTVASIETGSWSVSVPAADSPADSPGAEDGEGPEPAWIALPLGVLGLGLLAIRSWRGRRGRAAPAVEFPADPFTADGHGSADRERSPAKRA